MNKKERFKIEYFDLLLVDFKKKILGRAHGNYSKSYESFKRINNTERFFLEALAGRDHPAVLDIGCGDGYHVCVFNTIGGMAENAYVYGIDLSKSRVEFASLVCRELSFSNIRWLVGSAETLPFSSDRFDITLCSDVVEHLAHPDQCFAEMFRVLKPGGVAIVTTPNATSRIPWLVQLLKGPKPLQKTDFEDHISLKGIAEWIAIARAAGFSVANVKRGALLFGGSKMNQYPGAFAVSILIDRLFDLISFLNNWGEAITLKLRK